MCFLTDSSFFWMPEGGENKIQVNIYNTDFYYYDEDNYCLEGNRTGTVYQLGNIVKVKIRNVDIVKKEIDLILLYN